MSREENKPVLGKTRNKLIIGCSIPVSSLLHALLSVHFCKYFGDRVVGF